MRALDHIYLNLNKLNIKYHIRVVESAPDILYFQVIKNVGVKAYWLSSTKHTNILAWKVLKFLLPALYIVKFPFKQNLQK